MSNGKARRGGSRATGFVLMWIIGPLLVMGLLAVGVVLNPPTRPLLDLVARAFNKQTGYMLSFGPDSSIVLWPKGVVALSDVEIRRPALYPTVGGLIADAKKVTAEFDLVSLIIGPRAIDTIEIETATVTAHEADARLLRENLAAASKAADTRGVTVRRFALKDALVTYQVAPPNPAVTLTGLEAQMSNIGRHGVEKFTARFDLNEEPVTVSGAAMKSKTASAGTDVTASIESAQATAALEGIAGRPGADGAELFSGEALIQLKQAGPALRWLGIGPQKDHPALAGPMTLTGPMTLKRGVVSFRDVLFKSALADGSGEVTGDFTGPRPKISGRVAWQRLDLEGIGQPVRGPRALAVVSRPAREGLVIPSLWEELKAYLESIEATGAAPEAAAIAPRAASSRAAPRSAITLPTPNRALQPIDLAFLKVVDLDLAHSAHVIKYNGIELGDVAIQTHLDAGRLAVEIAQADFASGRWRGTFDVDARDVAPRIVLKLRGSGVAADGLQQAALGESTLTGRGDVTADLDAHGRSPEDLVQSLSGTVRVDIGEGNLIGYDLKAILTQFWRGWSYDARRRTPFNKIDAQVRLNKGVVQTIGYASLRGGEAEVDSQGTVSLVAQSLDQRIRARLTWPPNQLPLPARIRGPWTSPKVSIDWSIFSTKPGYVDLPPGLDGWPGASDLSFAPGASARTTMPDALAKDIARVLGNDEVAAKLPKKLRRTLENLAGRGGGT